MTLVFSGALPQTPALALEEGEVRRMSADRLRRTDTQRGYPGTPDRARAHSTQQAPATLALVHGRRTRGKARPARPTEEISSARSM